MVCAVGHAAFYPQRTVPAVRQDEYSYGRRACAGTLYTNSWLNMAEVELAVVNGQCLDRRIGDIVKVRREVQAWEARRNTAHTTINWRFTNELARDKLERVYPA